MLRKEQCVTEQAPLGADDGVQKMTVQNVQSSLPLSPQGSASSWPTQYVTVFVVPSAFFVYVCIMHLKMLNYPHFVLMLLSL